MIRLRKMRHALDKMTETVAAISRTTNYNAYPAQISQLEDQALALQAATRFSADKPPWQRAGPEYSLFMASFTAFLLLVTARLKVLEHTATPPSGFLHFRATFGLLAVASAVCLKWNNMSPASPDLTRFPRLAGLHAALVEVMTWLLSATRSGSPAWDSLCTEESPELSVVDSMTMILGVSIDCIHHINGQSSSEAGRQLCALPSSFIPLVCCLAYEQLGEEPRTPLARRLGRRWQRWEGLTQRRGPPGSLRAPRLIAILSEAITTSDGILARQGCPRTVMSGGAPIQVLKLALAVLAQRGSSGEDEHHSRTAGALNHLIFDRLHAGVQQRSSTAGASTLEQDPLPLTPFSDSRLLRILAWDACSDPRSGRTQLELMRLILGSHAREEGELGGKLATTSLHTSLVIVAAHCSSLAFVWMLGNQSSMQQQRHALRSHVTPQHQEPQVSISESKQAFFSQELMLEVRMLLVAAGASGLPERVAGSIAVSDL
ncbi:MAG: hypothetical protein WDW36_003209 [Sanguina aurantia]